MKTHRLTSEEQETHCHFNKADRVWVLWSEVPKHQRKFTRLGYKQKGKTEWEVSERCVSFRKEVGGRKRLPARGIAARTNLRPKAGASTKKGA